MSNKNYIKPERIWLKSDSTLSEKWVQDRLAEDASLLGLGDLVLRDRERAQPRAGRLDLLFQDPDTQRRYEVEVQLGATDEAHIIRTIEYWDIERKRYPQYDHCAVIVAEDITSRFLNVLSLFNGAIPLIAIQMQALKIGESVTLVFTTVVDELSRGLVDEDEDAAAVPTDRTYWEHRATKGTIELADEVLGLLHRFDPTLKLKYNKFYIGLEKNGEAFNFVALRPRKNLLRLEVKLPESEAIVSQVEAQGLTLLDYNKRWGQYIIQLTGDEVRRKADFLTDLAKQAWLRRTGGG